MDFTKFFADAKGQKKESGKRKKKKEGNAASKSFGKRSSPYDEQVEGSKQKTRPNKRKKGPSEDALKLSEKLKEFSRNKNLDSALKEYWDPSNEKIRDGFHACILVDCSARCGRVSEGEKIIQQLKEANQHVNIETLTALLKGYVHSGDIAKAEKLFVSMSNAKAKSDLPNVRSLNTLLRGCLWNAACVDEDGMLVGGVITAEKAWALMSALQKSGKVPSCFDISSFEYSILLLCQALRTEEGETRIKQLKIFFGVSEDSMSIEQSISEALAISYLSLARAYSMLGEKDKAASVCCLAIDFTKKSRQALSTANATNDDHAKKGKASADGRRAESNVIYREHRLSEVEAEATTIKEIVVKIEEPFNSRQLARRLLLRLLVLAGGGTTDTEFQTYQPKLGVVRGVVVQCRLINAAYFSYGLDIIMTKMGLSLGNRNSGLRKKDCNRILGNAGLQGGIIKESGVIDFHRLFGAVTGKGKSRKRKKKARPLEIELGAGFGDWMVKKAMSVPERDFLAVELRADRVGQTFARTSILSSCSPIENLCSVGAESGSLLLNNIDSETVSAIYINHPEPPTQTFGVETDNLQAIMDGKLEPAHMVNVRTLLAAARCLTNSPESRLVIVTDNKWYGRLICATLVRVKRENPNLLFQVDLTKHHYQRVDCFPEEERGRSNDSIVLYEGQPDENIGHAKLKLDGEGASYFDRLWKKGAGSHAEQRSRFVIVMARGQP